MCMHRAKTRCDNKKASQEEIRGAKSPSTFFFFLAVPKIRTQQWKQSLNHWNTREFPSANTLIVNF